MEEIRISAPRQHQIFGVLGIKKTLKELNKRVV
jgi:hypothetical protein